MRKLLLVFAHPDDESFVAGAAASYAKRGWEIERIFTTESIGESIEPIFQEMLEFIPDVVITFEPLGINNHPDHKNISRSATFAFQKYAKEFEKSFPDADPPKLYFACVPKSQIVYFQKHHKIPKEAFGRSLLGVDDKKIATVVAGEFFILRMVGTKEAFMGKNETILDEL